MKISPSKTCLFNLVDALFDIAQLLPPETIVKVLPWKFQPNKMAFPVVEEVDQHNQLVRADREKNKSQASFPCCFLRSLSNPRTL